MNNELYIYKKAVDWSALHLGFNIPLLLQDVFYENLNFQLKRGESRRISLMVGNDVYPATMTNIKFDEVKYPNHKDLLQIRYTANSLVAQRMREVFTSSYEYLRHEKEQLENKKKPLSVPHDICEYLAVYSTELVDTLILDCITTEYIMDARATIQSYDEQEIENFFEAEDNHASIVLSKERFAKFRKLDKSISKRLKEAYNYRCQICGAHIGDKYDAKIIHAHHIDFFSKSLNNDSSNIMIVCPNHHSVIHVTNPVFDRTRHVFLYPNGYTENLMLNFHL
jgi:predicted restriction endonuclease